MAKILVIIACLLLCQFSLTKIIPMKVSSHKGDTQELSPPQDNNQTEQQSTEQSNQTDVKSDDGSQPETSNTSSEEIKNTSKEPDTQSQPENESPSKVNDGSSNEPENTTSEPESSNQNDVKSDDGSQPETDKESPPEGEQEVKEGEQEGKEGEEKSTESNPDQNGHEVSPSSIQKLYPALGYSLEQGPLWSIVCLTKDWGRIPGKLDLSGHAFFTYDYSIYYCEKFFKVNGKLIWNNKTIPEKCTARGKQNDNSQPLYNVIAVTQHGNIPGKASSALEAIFSVNAIRYSTENFYWIC